MMDLEAIWKLARAELVVPAIDGGNDIFLWEHSVRVAQSAQYLSRLPELRPQEPDSLALWAAGLFHEAGWISRFRAGEIERYEILLGSPLENIVIESIRIMQHALSGAIAPPTVTRACEAIKFRTSHTTDILEGRILSDADNLEEFGLGFLWTAIRRGICMGKGVQSVLDAWKRRTEYQFWSARLKDAFFLDASRKVAESRLQQLELFMSEMTIQHEVEDVRRLIESFGKETLTPVLTSGNPDIRIKTKG